MCGDRAATTGARYAAGSANPREKGKPWKYETEPGRLSRLFTLHDASLREHVGPKELKVNQGGAATRQLGAFGLAPRAGS